MKKIMTLMVFSALASMSYSGITSVESLGIGAAEVNLTHEGSVDWVMLGQGGDTTVRDEKAGVDYIGKVMVSGSNTAYAASRHQFTWTDGENPNSSASAVRGNWEAKPDGASPQFLSFSVDGLAEGNYSMKIYTGSYKADELLTASIGESTVTASQASGEEIATSYSIAFSIEKAGEFMVISFKRNSAGSNIDSNVNISAITIEEIEEPDTLGLITAFGFAFISVRRVSGK